MCQVKRMEDELCSHLTADSWAIFCAVLFTGEIQGFSGFLCPRAAERSMHVCLYLHVIACVLAMAFGAQKGEGQIFWH